MPGFEPRWWINGISKAILVMSRRVVSGLPVNQAFKVHLGIVDQSCDRMFLGVYKQGLCGLDGNGVGNVWHERGEREDPER